MSRVEYCGSTANTTRRGHTVETESMEWGFQTAGDGFGVCVQDTTRNVWPVYCATGRWRRGVVLKPWVMKAHSKEVEVPCDECEARTGADPKQSG